MKKAPLQVKTDSKHTELLTTEEVAGMLKLKPRTLINWRHEQKHLPHQKIGGVARYRLVDVVAFIERSTVEPTMV
jgi:hypothetical protein